MQYEREGNLLQEIDWNTVANRLRFKAGDIVVSHGEAVTWAFPWDNGRLGSTNRRSKADESIARDLGVAANLKQYVRRDWHFWARTIKVASLSNKWGGLTTKIGTFRTSLGALKTSALVRRTLSIKELIRHLHWRIVVKIIKTVRPGARTRAAQSHGKKWSQTTLTKDTKR